MQSERDPGLANALTIAGHVAYAAWLAGGPSWLAVASLVADELDGRIARATGTESATGAVLDWAGDIAATHGVAQRLGLGPVAPIVTVGQALAKGAGIRPPLGSTRAVLTLLALWRERKKRRGPLPARELPDEDARRELARAHDEGRCRLVRLNPNVPHGVTLAPNVGGVVYRYRVGAGKDAPAIVFAEITPRLGVLLVRLAAWAEETFRAYEIHHMGAAPGHGGAHAQGRAIDIAGMRVNVGRAPDRRVSDWGVHAGMLHLKRAAAETWPALYAFATREAKDRPGQGPSRIGEASYLITRYHPDPALAAAHRDHFHVEVP